MPISVCKPAIAFVQPTRNEPTTISAFSCRLVNPVLAHMLGRTTDECTGKPVSTLFPLIPEDEFFALLMRVRQSDESLQVSYHHVREGVDQVYQLTLTPLDDQIMISVLDSTEQQTLNTNFQQCLTMASLITDIASQLISTPTGTLTTGIVNVLQQVSRYMKADRAAIFLYSEDGQRGRCAYEWCAPGVQSGTESSHPIAGTGFAWTHQQMEGGQLVHLRVDALTPAAIEEKRMLADAGVQTMTLVPLLPGKNTVGFIGFYALQLLNSWDHTHTSFLETFATLIAGVLQREQQKTTILRANQRLAGLNDIDGALVSYKLAGQSPLQLALTYIHFMVPCNRITVLQLNQSTNQLVAKGRVVEGVLEIDPDFSFPAQYVYNPTQLENKLIYYPDLQVHTVGVPPELGLYEQGFRSLAIAPLYSQNTYIGAFVLLSSEPFFFTEEYRLITEELANPLALILYQQQLDEQLQQYTRQLEEKIAERTQQIQHLSTRYETILQYAGQAILSCTNEGVIQTANQACEYILGYTHEELIGRHVRSEKEQPDSPIRLSTYASVEEAGPPSNLLLNVLSTQGYFVCECLATTKAGSATPLLLATSALLDANGAMTGYIGIGTDISALKATEAKLRQTNTELNTVFNGAIDLHAILALDGHWVNTNQAMEMVLGYAKDELTNMTIWDIIHPDEIDSSQQLFQQLLEGEGLNKQTVRLRKNDGSYCLLEWNGQLIDQRIYTSSRDITARELAEQAIQASEKQYRSLVDHLEEVIFYTDATGAWVYLNPAWEQVTGFSVDESLGTFFLDAILPEDRAATRLLFEEIIDHKVDHVKQVMRYIHKTGGYRWIDVFARAVLNELQEITGITGSLTDITERHTTQQALQESEQRFRQIAELVDELFWIRDIQGKGFAYINPTYEKFTGQSVQSLYDNPLSFLNFVLEEDRARIAAMFNDSKPGVVFDFRARHQDGSIRWLSARLFWVYNEAGEVIRRIGVASDITSSIAGKQILEEALEKERALNDLKSQFIATASHEFRTPLTVISTSVELLKYYANLNPENSVTQSINKHADNISQKVVALNELIMDTLSISKLAEGKQSVKLELTDLIKLVETMVALDFADRPDKRQVEVLIEGLAVAVLVDKKLMTHVLTNLLTNAFKFSKGNPLLSIRYERKTCRIEVTDNGIGIPPKDLPNLFSKFFRASNATTFQGTGLGLAICQEYVTLQNGVIEIDGTEGVGTTFRITLPLSYG